MSSSVVAIVGRPNVGKSTLFNRLVGQQVAIVDDLPGVTRDRLYGHAEWLTHRFTVIDTGGIDFNNTGVIGEATRLQAQIAIDEADLILFMVDGKTGVTPGDRDIADLLRRTSKPVILVVNKVDDFGRANEAFDFYELGLGDPIPISASHGKNTGDMLDLVVSKLPQEEDSPYGESITKIAVVGRPNVGKSSLVNRLLGEERVIVSDIPGTTRDAIDTYFQREDREYVIIDTAGLRKKGRIWESVEKYSVIRTLKAVDTSDVVLMLIDGPEGLTEQDMRIAGYAHESGRALIVVVNKWDIVDKEHKNVDAFTRSIRNGLAFADYAPILFISAKTGQRVERVLSTVDEVIEQYSRQVSTSTLNQILEEALLKTPAPTRKGQKVSLYYITQVATRPPAFRLFVNEPSRVHFSYLRYLENELRSALGFTGTPIRIYPTARK